MDAGTKVRGVYFGVRFAGVVRETNYWTDRFGRDGDDSVHVTLDSPIMVNGVERTGIAVTVGNGRSARYMTIEACG